MISFKLAASLLVLLSALGLARMAGRPYQIRVQTLEQWQRLVRHLMPLIEWRKVPLAQALRDASRGMVFLAPGMASLARRLEGHDGNFLAAWQEMLLGQPGLWEEDRASLADLGKVLGMSEASYQHDHLAAVHADLDRLADSARDRALKDGRLFPALVSALGVMVVILLL